MLMIIGTKTQAQFQKILFWIFITQICNDHIHHKYLNTDLPFASNKIGSRFSENYLIANLSINWNYW